MADLISLPFIRNQLIKVKHSVMQAVTTILGDHVQLIDRSYEFRGLPSRTYASIFAAGEEAGISRLYGGIHYHPSINVGLSLGKELGNRIRCHKA